MGGIHTWCFFFLFAGVISGCNYRREKMDMPLGVVPTFAAVQQYVLSPKCMGCHSGAGSPMTVDLSSYETIMARGLVTPLNPEQSPLLDSIVKGRMPKGNPLNEALVNLVRTWIEMGALKSGSPVEDPPPQPTYEWISRYVFEKRCNTCHNGLHEKTKLNLLTYESLMAYEGEVLLAVEPGEPEFSLLYRSINNQTMPPVGDKLKAEVVTAIRDWIASGASKESQ